MKKLFCTVISATIICVLAAGCKDAENSSSHGNMIGSIDESNMDLKDMPYGSYVTELSPNVDEHLTYKICFDSRYFEKTNSQDYTEIYKLHDFILAINKNNHELMESLFYPGYLEFISKKDGMSDIDTYLDNLYNYVLSTLGEGFEINYINISNCYSDEDESSSTYFESIDDELAEFDSSLLSKTTSKKYVEIGGDTLFENSNGSSLITDYMEPFLLRLYEIDGEVYLFM